MKAAPSRPASALVAQPGSHLHPTRRKYRVLKIAPTYFFGETGCHVRILEEVRALQALGSQVTVCTYAGGDDVPDVTIERAAPLPGYAGVKVGSSRAKPFLDLLLLARSVRVALRLRPDVVHAHIHEGALIGYLVSRLLRVPLVFDFQGSLTSEMVDHDFLRPDSLVYRPLYWLEGIIDRHADVVLTSTCHAARLLVDEFGCRPERIRPLPDAVNTSTFRPAWEMPLEQKRSLRRRLGIPLDRRLVVYIGLLAEYQGASHLLNAATQVVRERPDVHFLLMGYPGQERYRALARTLGIGEHVSFTGRLPYSQAPDHLALGDLAVAPKVSRTEGNGKLLNYMSVGLPTVAFDTPVNRDILGELGEYAELGDAADLARAMLRLLGDPEEARARGRRLRERAVREFSWESTGERIADVYERLVR